MTRHSLLTRSEAAPRALVLASAPAGADSCAGGALAAGDVAAAGVDVAGRSVVAGGEHAHATKSVHTIDPRQAFVPITIGLSRDAVCAASACRRSAGRGYDCAVLASRFLLVRLGALGDVVHAIPVAAALRQAFPSARIDWLVSGRHRPILDLVPVIDGRIAVADRRGTSTDLSAMAAIRLLRGAHYDAALDLQGLIKSASFARASGASRVIGFAPAHLREPLARFCYSETYDPGAGGMFDRSATRHVVAVNLGMLERLGVHAGPPEFPIESVDTAIAADVRRRTGGRYALLNPGAAWPNKRWPPERLAAVARELKDRHGLMSVVLWGPGEQPLADAVVEHSKGAAMATPPTSIRDLVALARGAAIMVSGDTGPTHIAAAVGTPLVGIYGPTRPARNGPWRADDVTVSRDATCECHHLRQCRRARMCLLDIEAGEVLEAVEQRLARGGSR